MITDIQEIEAVEEYPINTSEVRIRITINAVLADDRPYRLNSGNKRLVMMRIRRQDEIKRADLTIRYYRQDQQLAQNSTTCTSKDDLLKAIDDFTESDLLVYAAGLE